MKLEDRELLLKDLCARLPYGVKCQIGELTPLKLESIDINDVDGLIFNFGKDNSGYRYDFYLSEVRPYLRPMSSMTEEEYNSIKHLIVDCAYHYSLTNKSMDGRGFKFERFKSYTIELIDWLNAHHFDYRGLIEKGLAIEAPDSMYNN